MEMSQGQRLKLDKFKAIYEKGFNIYMFLNRFKKELRNSKSTLFPDQHIPDEIILPLLDKFDKDFYNIENKFAWLVSSLKRSIKNWWVNKQIYESNQLKFDKVIERDGKIESVKSVLDRMLREGGFYEIARPIE